VVVRHGKTVRRDEEGAGVGGRFIGLDGLLVREKVKAENGGEVAVGGLAGVLALSVLTGCNNSAATVTMVDALNDWSKVYGEGVTFEKGNEDLQNQVNALVKIVDEASEKIDFKDAKDFEDVYNTFMENDAAKLKLGAWAAQFTKANIGDGSPLYEYGFADISATLSASSSKNIYYAEQLMNASDANQSS